jgi:hypothetical protein
MSTCTLHRLWYLFRAMYTIVKDIILMPNGLKVACLLIANMILEV